MPDETRGESEPVQGAATKPTGLTRNVLLLSAASFLTDVSSEMSITFLPFFLANVLGVKTALIGLIEGIAESGAALTRVLSGYLADRWRRCKGLVLLGYGISAISKPFLYFAASWGSVLGIRFVDRVGKGVRTSPRDALLAASAPRESRGFSFGFHRGADTAGAFLGLSLVALVIYLMQGSAAYLQAAAFRRIILIAAVPGLLAVAVLWAVREPAQCALPAETEAGPRPRFSGRFKLFLVAVGLFALANSSDAFLLLRAQNLGLSVFGVAVLLAAFNLAYSLISPLAGRWSDRVSRASVVALGWGTYSVTYLGFALARQSWHVWALFGLYAIYYGVAEGTARALVADLVPAEQRGMAYGLYSGIVGAAALPASLLAGVVWEGIGTWGGWGASAPFFVGGALSALAVLLLLSVVRRTAVAAT
ncbi:MAG: MFS transporter [Armatimonadetes bacterium]|nr:MFS transporter [Armatimonadota bacterium]